MTDVKRKAKKQNLLRICVSKNNKLYAEAVTDFELRKGERLSLLDPRQFLNKEQVADLEEHGELEMTTPSGKTYKLYASLAFEVVKFVD